MVVWIDGKNPALYASGISSWLQNILENLSSEEVSRSQLISPRVNNKNVYPEINMKKIKLPWSSIMPRKLNHIIYDILTFRVYSFLAKPEKVFSPYFDVLTSRRVPTVITVHDLCFLELPQLYSPLQRLYYLSLLKKNAKRAKMIVTVSETSKKAILENFDLTESKILVIPNGLNYEFTDHTPSSNEIYDLRQSFGENSFLILYTSGFENRKNLNRLLEALCILDAEGVDFKFLITGKFHSGWDNLLAKYPTIKGRVRCLGYLSEINLKTLYAAADVVVFPSLSEGFGRSCMESMSTGTPLACSDLSVFREVAGDYAKFFSPTDSKEMSLMIYEAIKSGRKEPVRPKRISESTGFMELREYLFGSPKYS